MVIERMVSDATSTFSISGAAAAIASGSQNIPPLEHVHIIKLVVNLALFQEFYANMHIRFFIYFCRHRNNLDSSIFLAENEKGEGGVAYYCCYNCIQATTRDETVPHAIVPPGTTSLKEH